MNRFTAACRAAGVDPSATDGGLEGNPPPSQWEVQDLINYIESYDHPGTFEIMLEMEREVGKRDPVIAALEAATGRRDHYMEEAQ